MFRQSRGAFLLQPFNSSEEFGEGGEDEFLRCSGGRRRGGIYAVRWGGGFRHCCIFLWGESNTRPATTTQPQRWGVARTGHGSRAVAWCRIMSLFYRLTCFPGVNT
jgi:hypothetical protein